MEPPAIVAAEDAVEVLIRHFVSPLLPGRRISRPPPTADQQKEVGKQMQAVAILYNYYQRKQSSNSKFLGFRSFWETACICSPSLVDYLKFMCNDAQSLDDLHNQLSITEKLVMDACDICTALNTLSVSCTIDEWPISKVAVFLVDAANEKCLLKNDSIILGSWSLVEKDIEKPIEKLTNAYDVEDVLQKIAYSSVEQDMGITCSNLNTLEYHFSYSLSQLKSSTVLFIMSYKVPVSSVTEIPIEDLISLQGLPVTGSSCGLKPEITAVAEHYCLLPYIEIIAEWASRKNSRGDSMFLPRKKTIANSSDLPLITWNPQVSSQSKSNKATADDGCLYSLHQRVDVEHKRVISGKKKIKVEYEANGQSQCSFQCKASSLSLLDHNENPCHDNSGSKGFISKKLGQNSKSTQCQGASHLILDGLKNQVECSADKKCLARSDENILERVHTDFTNQAKAEDSALQLIPACPIVNDCAKRFLTLASNKYDLEIFILEFLKNRRDELCCQQRLLEDLIAHCEMNIQAMICAENQTSQSEVIMKAFDFLRSSSNRGPHSVEVKLNPNHVRRKRLFDADLRLRSPCQELDQIFRRNHWILPKYSVLLSVDDGKFQSIVMTKGLDFEYTLRGDPKDAPTEARESAAACMLTKLREMSDQVCQDSPGNGLRDVRGDGGGDAGVNGGGDRCEAHAVV
ncbi:hypothetical protein KSP39_PZI018133 [Platanthera zijinensis]|uniref:Uncharacterized protein n=1 Tax=Platanthera zijinensis TaxID=2320716 RepID=A0AAP0B3R1_9ASPA